MTKVLYPISADPITFGHLDIIARASKLFDKVIVGIAQNDTKNYLFTEEERFEMVKKVTQHLPNVFIVSYKGLTVDYAWQNNINVIIRGIRGEKDLEYETVYQNINNTQFANIEHLSMFSRPEYTHISSSVVKSLVHDYGFIHQMVPLLVKQELEKKVHQQYFIGLSGEIACGKSYVAKELEKVAKSKQVDFCNIELDELNHEILTDQNFESYKIIRQEIFEIFGQDLEEKDGSVNRKKLGKIVFENPQKREELEAILWPAVLKLFRQKIQGKTGIILINAALLAEAKMLWLCNNNLILISTSQKIQHKRLKNRGLNGAEIENRLSSQKSFLQKKSLVESAILKDKHGEIIYFENLDASEKEVEKLFGQIQNLFKK